MGSILNPDVPIMPDNSKNRQARNIIDTVGEIRQRILNLEKKDFDLQKVFQKLDPQHSGEVSETTFNYVLERELEISEIHTQYLKRLLQVNGEKDINYKAFINLLFNSNELFKYPLFRDIQEGNIS